MQQSVSMKKSTDKTNIKHNNRTMSEKEMERNNHIDYSRSHLNKYLVQENIKALYEREFGEALEKYNAKQKRSDRKIKNYYQHIQKSKKTCLQQEMIIQVGDKDDFKTEVDRDQAVEILERWFRGFQERNPQLKVYNAVIHNDEASPHMHLNFVPVAEGYKRGLEKQVAFDKAILQQDSTLDKNRPFDDWREKEVTVIEKMLIERGIERKLVGPNEYKDITEYKQKKDELKEIALETSKLAQIATERRSEVKVLTDECKYLESEANGLKNDLKELRQEYDTKKNEIAKIDEQLKVFDSSNEIANIEVKKPFLKKGVVEVNEKDWLDIVKKVELAEVLKTKNVSLETDVRVEKKLTVYQKGLAEKYRNESEKYKSAYEGLKQENELLKTENNFLKRTIEKIKEMTIEKMPELANVIGYAKAVVLDQLKEKLLKNYFVDEKEVQGVKTFMNEKQERLEEEAKRPSKSKTQDFGMDR